MPGSCLSFAREAVLVRVLRPGRYLRASSRRLRAQEFGGRCEIACTGEPPMPLPSGSPEPE
jgi:hypothetical protein